MDIAHIAARLTEQPQKECLMPGDIAQKEDLRRGPASQTCTDASQRPPQPTHKFGVDVFQDIVVGPLGLQFPEDLQQSGGKERASRSTDLAQTKGNLPFK